MSIPRTASTAARVALLLLLPALARAQDPAGGVPSIVPPRLLASEPAVYPADAMALRVGAVVTVEILVRVDGSAEVRGEPRVDFWAPDGAEVVTSTGSQGFVDAALEAVSSLEFEPARTPEGGPVDVIIEYAFRFDPPAPSEPTPSETMAPPPVRISGEIRERGTRKRLPGVAVVAFRGSGDDVDGIEVVTDEDGVFRFYGLDDGPWKIYAEPDGYFPFRTTEVLAAGDALDVRYYLERGRMNPYDVVVEASAPKKEVTRRTLTREELRKVPGTLGDPVLVVENLPGVARPALASGDIIVRGSGPQDTGVFIDGIQVPIIYHFGGLRSVLPADVIDQIEFYPGNFSTRYGRFTGGILNAQTRGLDAETVRGTVDVSLLDASLLLEVPISKKLSILAAGRRSYIDAVLGAAIGDQTVSLTTAPRYYDFQAIVDWHPNRVHRFKLTVIGSDDELVATFESPADIDVRLRSGDTNVNTTFGRAIASHQFTPNEKLSNRVSFSAGFDQNGGAFGGQFDFDFDTIRFDMRDDFRWQIIPTVELVSGLDAFFATTDYSVLASRPPREGDPVPPGDLANPLFSEATGVEDFRFAPFVEADWRLFDRLSVIPGARMDYFSRLDALTFDPRIVVRYDWSPQLTTKGGVALVHQQPTLQELDPEFGNPELEPQRAIQYSIGQEWRPLDYLSFDVTLFYKDIQNLVSSTGATRTDSDGTTSPLVYDNGGTGEVFGLETFIEHKFNRNFRGWLSYTLSSARRTDSGESRSRFFDFDQTHIFSIVGSYLLPANWEVGVRYRVVSGNPYTPFTGGIFVSDRDEFEAITGRVNSERLPAFHQLDFRVDKTWVYRTWQLSAYLSLTNAYNQSNVEAISYNYDFTQRGQTTGLPILPILGLRAEF